jgi:uncharacterized protein (TIGR02996 family)
LVARFSLALIVLLALNDSTSAQVMLDEPCVRTETFPMPRVSGPWDYRKRDVGPSVTASERSHFTPQVENLVRGITGPLPREFSFMLHGWPNHHRALAALIRWAERDKSRQPGGLDYSVDCYFLRAIRFRPDDLIVRMLFADYLSKTGRPEEAVPELDRVRVAAGDNPLTQYNLGLLYFQVGRYADARAQAHRAMELGLERTELRDRLQAKGQWAAPPEPAAAAASSATPAASAASTPAR